MNALDWIIVALLGIIFIVLLGFVIVALKVRPYSKKMTHAQAQINKKQGATSTAAPTPAPAAPVATPTYRSRAADWGVKNLWSVILALVGIGAIIWALNTQMTFAEMMAKGQDHRLAIGIGWLVIAGLIGLNAKALGSAAKVLQWVVGGIAISLLFGTLVTGWLENNGSSAKARSVPLASSPQSEWPKLTIPPNGKSELVPVPPGMHMVMSGDKFRLHNVYRDGRECAFGDSCPNVDAVQGVYATNETNVANIVAFAYKPIQ